MTDHEGERDAELAAKAWRKRKARINEPNDGADDDDIDMAGEEMMPAKDPPCAS